MILDQNIDIINTNTNHLHHSSCGTDLMPPSRAEQQASHSQYISGLAGTREVDATATASNVCHLTPVRKLLQAAREEHGRSSPSSSAPREQEEQEGTLKQDCEYQSYNNTEGEIRRASLDTQSGTRALCLGLAASLICYSCKPNHAQHRSLIHRLVLVRSSTLGSSQTIPSRLYLHRHTPAAPRSPYSIDNLSILFHLDNPFHLTQQLIRAFDPCGEQRSRVAQHQKWRDERIPKPSKRGLEPKARRSLRV